MMYDHLPRLRPRRAVFPVAMTAVVSCLLLSLVMGSGPPLPAGVGRGLASSEAHDSLLCNGGSWYTTHLEVYASGCQALFVVDWAQNFSSENYTGQYNFSFAIADIAEFTPSGHIVRVAEPLDPYGGTANSTVGPHEVNLTSIFHMNVTNASGNWTPNDALWGTGPPWTVSTAPVGTTELTVVFHLLDVTASSGWSNGTGNPSLSVKFDLQLASWPWVSSHDLLGVCLESLGAEASHFEFNTTSRSLAESWNRNNVTFVSLVFGGQATTLYPNLTSASAPVTEQVGLFPAVTPDREAVVLANFTGVPGNYTNVAYDPWVVFSSADMTSVPPSVPAPGPAGFPGWVVAALVVGAVVVGIALVTTYVARSSKLRKEGLELVRGMRDAISDREPVSPSSKGR